MAIIRNRDALNSDIFAEGFKENYDTKGNAPYKQVLSRVREGVASRLKKQVDTMSETELKGLITQYIREHNIKCELTPDISVLVNHIYHDMAGLSFISRENLFAIPGFEELDINSWDKVEIQINGKRQDTDYAFLSPKQAIDIIERIFRRSSTPFDLAAPRASADISVGIRIEAMRTPIVDQDVAVSASIRKVNLSTVNRDKLIGTGLTAEMMQFLELCIHHGCSVVISGETGAGKTTLAGALLREASMTMRLFTIEEGVREWDFRHHDQKTGKITNSVIQTRTRYNDNEPDLSITQEDLVKAALRYNPDSIAPSEIRGQEAFEVMQAANTGHTVVTTVHSNGTLDTPQRIVTLAKKAYNMDDQTLYSMFVRAFPILVHMEKGADQMRRVTEIREVTGIVNGIVQSRLLFEFDIEDNRYEGDTCTEVVGSFRHLTGVSEGLVKRLLKKGAKRSEIKPFMEGDA